MVSICCQGTSLGGFSERLIRIGLLGMWVEGQNGYTNLLLGIVSVITNLCFVILLLVVMIVDMLCSIFRLLSYKYTQYSQIEDHEYTSSISMSCVSFGSNSLCEVSDFFDNSVSPPSYTLYDVMLPPPYEAVCNSLSPHNTRRHSF
ncbi:putative membrane protein [Ehrlichia ruminantium]|uniref:hypothetical protein n=1 Tax=Ehrlichia ruminantium TaxID=779 RepID=UPI0007C12D4E|nr:hypothetical protein [Ehrlichia ruminantium]QLK52663.1 hypothetical protein FDZ65_04110 [Ehrlichia ruminantium]QLK54495.1 hypothetical protein FDZ63_04110 [Ehrlichia ruminantium]QLK57246.1 hypothetical protein FDZ60_04120 [Ehrlichia ruminantium]QLK58160.1 hypothetical protein FDZ59_04105 [Ehrlichia ruminantium]GAT76593.1 putative membrane protein [Ehrlichia ruminantium]